MIDLCLFTLPDRYLTNPTMYFPLGIAYIASVAKEAGYSVAVMDFRKEIGVIPESKFYGFSCCTPHIVEAKRIASIVKGKTIVGGAHATLLPEDCYGHFDYIIRGEGEEAILSILRNDWDAGTVIVSPRIDDLDSIPYPTRKLVEEPYSKALFPGERYGEGERASTLIASRGCPYKCSFCGNMFNIPVTFRSVENIIGELNELKSDNVYHFRFEDDNFTIHPEFERLCLNMKQLGIHYKCHTRSNLVKPRMMELLKLSGCEECGFGVESADDRVLEINNKRATLEDHKKAVKIIKDAGLRVKTYFMAGLPGETDETVKINKEFMLETKPDKWTLSTFTPYPGCDIWRNPDKYGVEIINSDYSKWTNFIEKSFNHVLIGQTQEQMWDRYEEFYKWLREYDAKAN